MNYFQTTSVDPGIKELIKEVLNIVSHPVMQHSVKELLWGYRDEALYQLQQLDSRRVLSTIVSIFNESVG